MTLYNNHIYILIYKRCRSDSYLAIISGVSSVSCLVMEVLKELPFEIQ